MSNDFVDLARAAFNPVATDAGFEFSGCLDRTWFAWVKWTRGVVGLLVRDDRRDCLIEVGVVRPLSAEEDVIDLSTLTRGLT